MSTFYTIRFRRNTAKRFKQFSRQIAVTYSEGLDCMIDFFEWHGFLPSDRFEKSISREILKNRQRMNANIAILKNIEKNQTLPSVSMLKLLFEQAPETTQQPKFVEKSQAEQSQDAAYQEALELSTLRNQLATLAQELQTTTQDLQTVLAHVELHKNSFGKQKAVLKLSIESIAHLKQKYH